MMSRPGTSVPDRPLGMKPGRLPTARLAWGGRPTTMGCAPALASALPADALAIIEPVPVATNQGGCAHHGKWRLGFATRARPFVDPLTGWTGGRDPLAQVELRFPSLTAAAHYCRGQQLRCEVRGAC